jgi:hypothetical protein
VRISDDKMRTKDFCSCVGTIYDPRELSEVSTTGPGIGWGVTSGIRSDPRSFTGVCGLGGSGIWRMSHVGPEWSHGMAYDDTRHTDMAKRGCSWIEVDRRRSRSSKGVDYDITWLRGEVPGLRLTDEEVGLLRGWIVISWPLGW